MVYQKRKWAIQLQQKRLMRKRRRIDDSTNDMVTTNTVGRTGLASRSLSGFMQSTANNILTAPWQIIQVSLSVTLSQAFRCSNITKFELTPEAMELTSTRIVTKPWN